MILFIESAAHKIFGGNGHSHFSENETLDVASRNGLDNNGYIGDHENQTSSRDQQMTNNSSENTPEQTNLITTLRSILFVVALSVHSLFEGLAIGLEDRVLTEIF